MGTFILVGHNRELTERVLVEGHVDLTECSFEQDLECLCLNAVVNIDKDIFNGRDYLGYRLNLYWNYSCNYGYSFEEILITSPFCGFRIAILH